MFSSIYPGVWFEQFVGYLLRTLILFGLPTILVSGFFLLTSRISSSEEPRIIPVAFSTFGTTIGMIAGLSRIDAITASLPVIVALVGGYVTYLFDKRSQDSAPSFAYGFALLSFFVGVGFGFFYGYTFHSDTG